MSNTCAHDGSDIIKILYYISSLTHEDILHFLPAVFPAFGSCNSASFSSYHFLHFFSMVDDNSLLFISEMSSLAWITDCQMSTFVIGWMLITR